MYAYFKLFNSIKDEHEVELARLELESLVGSVEVVRNFADELMKKPLKALVDSVHVTERGDESDAVRFQDFVMHEVPYGKVQGFVSRKFRFGDIEPLARKLGYTREIYVVDERKSWKRFQKAVFAGGSIGKNCNVFFAKGFAAVRTITNQYFLENSDYVLKITPSLKRERVIEFTDRMFDNLMRFVYRIPASAKARVGKRFLDYLGEREEPSLYLSHGLHPYKGKFHPKMTRALVNIVLSANEGTLVDNFSGSGTLLVESSLMGFDSYGIDINPMSVLMASAKCALMRVEPKELDDARSKFMKLLRADLDIHHQHKAGQSTLTTMMYGPDQSMLDEVHSVAPDVYEDFAPDAVLNDVLIARRIIDKEFSNEIKEILQLGLAIVISDLKGKKKKEFLPRIQFVMEDIFRRRYVLEHLRGIIPLEIGTGKAVVADCSGFKDVKEIRAIDGNVNSPPYSTALDYIKNDINQLALLGLVRNQDELRALEDNMGGNPRAKYDIEEMEANISKNAAGLCDYAIRLVRLMDHFDKRNHAFRLYNFFTLIRDSLAEQMRVLKPGAKIATVIGNNHFKLTDDVGNVSRDAVTIGGVEYPLSVHRVVNNLRATDPTPITGADILAQYGPDLPIKVSESSEETNASRSGVFVEVENERALLLLGMNLRFEPVMVINRYLEKTLRGNIRYESIVVLKKP